jgi:restriction system protein
MPYSNYQSEHQRQQRRLERERRAAERAAQDQQRQKDRQKKELEKVAREEHLKQRQKTTDNSNLLLKNRLTSLQTILNGGFDRTFKIDFDDVIQHSNAIPAHPGQPPLTPPKPEPPFLPDPPRPPEKPDIEKYRAEVPKPSVLEKHLGVGKNKRVKQGQEINQSYLYAIENYKRDFPIYLQALEEWKQRKECAQTELAQQLKEWQQTVHQQEIEYQTQIRTREQAISKFRIDLFSRNPEAVVAFQLTNLERSLPYPDGFPQRRYELSYDPKSSELVVQSDLPTFLSIMPTTKEFRYIKGRDQLRMVKYADADEPKLRELYGNILASVALRTIYEVFQADAAGLNYASVDAIEAVVFNGIVDGLDRATGRPIKVCLVSIRITRQELATIDLKHIESLACLEHLKGRISLNYPDSPPITPLAIIGTTFSAGNSDQSKNLIEMAPYEFEHLVAELFDKMGFRTQVTPPTRDGGIDVIAEDLRPIVGGEIFIQVKRYTHTVPIVEVRALDSLVNKKAIKGILVTTSHFGPESYKFAQDRPIELIDGTRLLALLREHGYDFRIEML